MRLLQRRVRIAVAASVFGTLAGALGGYLIGRATTLSQTETRLTQLARRSMDEGDAGTAESRRVLAQMNASRYQFCSDEEVAFFRTLIFQSRFLKDAGRLQGGAVACSTTFGRITGPQQRWRADITQEDGTLLYRDPPMFRLGKQTVVAIQLGDSYIVYNPFNPKPQVSAPMHYVMVDVDAVTHTTDPLYGEMPPVVLTEDGLTRWNHTMFATRCSSDRVACMTMFESIPDALQANRATILVFALLGAIAGGLLGFVCAIIHGRNHRMEHRLHRAIRRDELHVVYQPIVDLQTGEIVEAEALARWIDENDRPISPDVFIKAAEKAGFVGEITRLMVRHVLRDFGKTMRERPGFRVNVNIAAPDLEDPEFMPMLERALATAGIQPSSLGIEITESYTARQTVAKETILRLRQKGHFVHIDDFGTGYSSLAYLHDLSVDAIKIDKAFTKAIGTDAVTVSILPQILGMAETLGLRVVVEGIETAQQAAYFAAESQSIYAQGWLFGHPVSAESFHRLLEKKTQVSERSEPFAEDEGAVAVPV